MLDSDIAGCVEGFLKDDELYAQHTAILGRCYRDATLVARQLRDDPIEQVHFGRLERLAALTLETLGFRAPAP
jgi:hypothetical protein